MRDSVIEKIIAMLKDPKVEWGITDYTVCLGDLSIWTANVPGLNTNIHTPCALSLGIIDKFRLYKATQEAKKNAINRLIMKTLQEIDHD